MSDKQISVVMPYYNNEQTLLACLQSFAEQQGCRAKEIIVVDDGARISAASVVAQKDFAVPVRLLRSAHAGQSAATNVGIRAATGDIVLLTCADMRAVPTLLQQHLDVYAQAQGAWASTAVMGHIAYPASLTSRPFLQYLSTSGPQFCFGHIADAENVPGYFLYAPNVSVPREQLLHTGLFDEGFPYGFQDTELGVRLEAAGTRFVYRRRALAEHDHPNDVRNFMRRNRQVGGFLYRFIQCCPTVIDAAAIRQRLLGDVNNIAQVPHLLMQVDRFERAAMRDPLRWSAYKAALFAIYGILLGAAMMQGALEGDERLAQLLGFDAVQWQKLRHIAHQGASAPQSAACTATAAKGPADGDHAVELA